MNRREAEIIGQKVMLALWQKQESLGISNYQISHNNGISESTLSYLKNNNQNPRLSTMIMIANALNIPLSEIFKQVEEQLKPRA